MQTNRSNTGALVAGTILIVFGLMALAGQFFRVVNWGFLFSLAVTGIGALFFVAMFAGGRQAAAFAIPGSILGGIGLVLLFQFITRQWESMSYFWTLIIMFVGIGIYIMGWYSGDANQKRSGWRVMKTGFILFLIFGILFGLLTSNGLAFPILLIILGLYVLLSRSGLLSGPRTGDSSDNSIPPAS